MTLAKQILIATLLLSIGPIPSVTYAGNDWPNWRGPQYNGHSVEKGLPTKWSAKDVSWKAELKGRGQSSPTIFGERIFLTTALEKGRQRVVFCVDRNDGSVLWEHVAWTGAPEPTHRMNGFASASVATDGERVYAFFGKGGLHCYTVEGKHEWSRDLGTFVGPWGVAGCPLIVGDLVVQNCDADADAYILAVNKKTGETVWKTERNDGDGQSHRGWSTPIPIQFKGRDELVMNGHSGVSSYDPKSGKRLWFCKSFRGRGTPTLTPTPGNDLLFAVGGTAKQMMAVKPGGSGDVTETHRAWEANRVGGRDLPSPILIENHLLVCAKAGVLTCYNPQTGDTIWTERIGGVFTSTPISYSGLAFFINEDGETIAIKPGKQADIVARNTIDPGAGIFRASITPSDGQVYIRSDQTLYCVGKRKSSGR